MTVHESQVTFNHDGGSACASDIGLGAGEWPESIVVTMNSGAHWVFTKGPAIRHTTEFDGYDYFNRLGIRLAVFNE